MKCHALIWVCLVAALLPGGRAQLSGTVVQFLNAIGAIEDILFTSEQFVQDLLSTFTEAAGSELNPFQNLVDVPALVVEAGYPFEEYDVQTEDGYINKLFRIPFGSNGTSDNRPAVLLSHATFSSSSAWVAPGTQNGLAFHLADSGFDVWMLNARGTTYSRGHVSLNPTQKPYWNFSFHEIAVYDIPSSIDRILEVTGQTQVSYVGFSMGTRNFFAMASTRPEYNDKISSMVALAPVTIERAFSDMTPALEILYTLTGAVGEVPPSELFPNAILDLICTSPGFLSETLCDQLFLLAENDLVSRMSRETKMKIFNSYPNRGSLKLLQHYFQTSQSEIFRQFDYGPLGNLFRYGRWVPPIYDLTKVTAPVAFFWSRSDRNNREASGITDLNNIRQDLANFVLDTEITAENFQHVNFIWDDQVKEILNDQVVAFLQGQA